MGRAVHAGIGATSEKPRLCWKDFKTEAYESKNEEETKKEVIEAIK